MMKLTSRTRSSRKAAVRARRSITSRKVADPKSSSCKSKNSDLSLSLPSKSELEAANVIKEVIRNRKTRMTKLRDLAKDLLDEQPEQSRNRRSGNQRCPVCSQEVAGSHEESVMVAHVDACILQAAHTAEQSRLWNESRSGMSGDIAEYEIAGERRIRVTDLVGYRGDSLSINSFLL